jgi:hypothetical protein
MHKLLLATLRQESLIALRDRDIADIHKRRTPSIDKASLEIVILQSQIQQYYLENQESLEKESGKKSVQLANGLMGVYAPSHPALVPLNNEWTWARVEKKIFEVWKKKFFHAPKPPAIDKVKLKKELDAAQLKKLGLKLDDSETFYLELNRPATPDPLEYEQAA